MSGNFETKLKFGKVAESAIAKWLINRGAHVMPAYEIIDKKYAGPQLFGLSRSYVTPDLLTFSNKGVVWIEAKHKTAFTWHRITNKFVTGIDIKHWKDYIEVSRLTNLQCWILFNHLGGKAKDSPESPSGLYGNEIGVLSNKINHTHENWGKGGMVYWAINSLVKLNEALT